MTTPTPEDREAAAIKWLRQCKRCRISPLNRLQGPRRMEGELRVNDFLHQFKQLNSNFNDARNLMISSNPATQEMRDSVQAHGMALAWFLRTHTKNVVDILDQIIS